MSRNHAATDLCAIFSELFRDAERTLLLPDADAWNGTPCRNAAEPVYLPADAHCPFHRIVFAHGFFASALHEVAHWCIAGRSRRRQVDYGYWYRPDDRNSVQQAEFERVESRPQALEWAFALAAGFCFQVSVDNLSGVECDRAAFTRKVHGELLAFSVKGFPARAQRFIDALSGFYGTRFEVPAHV